MRLKTTLFLLLANVAVFGLILKFERGRDHDPVVDTPLFAQDIHEITIQAPGSVTQSYTLTKHQGGWRITAPFFWEADSGKVNHILEQLKFIRSDKGFTVREAADTGRTLASYGLENPEGRIVIRGSDDAKPDVIHIGRPDGNNSSSLFLLPMHGDASTASPLKPAPGDHIIPAPLQLLASFPENPEVLRASTIFEIGSFEVRSITIRLAPPPAPGVQVGANEIRIKRDQRPIPNQTDTELVWRFEAPVAAEASRPLVEAFLGTLTNLRYQRFLSRSSSTTPEQLSQYGLATPTMRIVLEGNNRFQSLLIGKTDPESPADNPAFFAKLENNASVFTVHTADILIWRDAQTDLREKAFFPFHPSELTEITIRENDKALVFHRRSSHAAPSTDDWGEWNIPMLPDSTATVTLAADPGLMRQLIKSIREIRAENALPKATYTPAQIQACKAFVTDAPTAEELKTLGFGQPARSVELAFRNGSRRTLIITAPAPDGSTPCHAKLSDAPSIYSIRENILDELAISPAKYKNRRVLHLPAGTALLGASLVDLAAENKELLAISRPTSDTPWETVLASRSPNLREMAGALIGQLDEIRAREYMDAPFNIAYKHSFLAMSAPEQWRYKLTLSIRTVGATKDETREIFFTKRLGGTTQIAGSPTQNCIFSIEQNLIDALSPLTIEAPTAKDVPDIPPPADIPPIAKEDARK
jgi:hypothetical protein